MRLGLSVTGNILGLVHINDTAGTNRGYVKVFEYSNNSWSQLGSTIYGQYDNEMLGFDVAVNSDGTIIGVGSQNDANGAGTVSIYKYANGSWSQMGSDIRR